MNTIRKGWKDMELDKELINLRIDVIERNLAEIQENNSGRIFSLQVQLP